ncbi:TetR/AcrR family transcriptional regulator [Streptacidiphilus sp. PAMC 29251]
MSDAAGQATDRAHSGEQTRARLLDIALDLFAEKGFDATTLQEIADRLDVTKAALYYYYPSKQKILEAILAVGHRRAIELLDQAEAQRSQSARVAVVVEGMIELAIQQRRTASILNHDPALFRSNTFVTDSAARRSRLQELIYGRNPSAAQRSAFQLATCIGDAVARLGDLTDEELRESLPPVVYRTLGLRRPSARP